MPLAGRTLRGFDGPGVGGIPHHLSEPQFLHLSCEGLSASQGSFEALMRKWDTDPHLCQPMERPRLCKCHLCGA